MTTIPTPIVLYSHTHPDGTLELSDRPVTRLSPLAPGETGIERLPGTGRLAFVRKRKPHKPSPFGLTTLVEALETGSRSRSVPAPKQYFIRPVVPPTLVAPPIPLAQPTVDQVETLTQVPVVSQGVQYSSPFVGQVSPSGVITESGVPPAVLVKQTCFSCGNIRSPHYQLRHPLKPGKMPRMSICRKCVGRETSSEDSNSSFERYRRRNRRRRRHSTETTEDGSSYSGGGRSHGNGGYHSHNRHGSHRSGTRPDTTNRTRPASAMTHASRRSRRSPSPQRVRIVERIRYVDPAQPSRSRHESRTSRSRHSTQEERSEETYIYSGGDDGYSSGIDGSPRGHRAEYDRRYEPVMEPELPIPRHRSNSLLVERGRTRYVDRQEFADWRPVVYTSQEVNHRTARDWSFEREPSVEIEETVRPRSRSLRMVRTAQVPYEQPLRSRPGRPVGAAHESGEPRQRSRSVRTVRVVQDTEEPRPRSRSVRTFHISQDSDEARPRSRSVRGLGISLEGGDPRAYVSAPEDPERVVLESRSRRDSPIRVHQYTETMETPRRTRRHRARETSDFQAEYSDDANRQGSPRASERYNRHGEDHTPPSYRLIRTRERASDSGHESQYRIHSRSASSGTPHSYVRTRNH